MQFPVTIFDIETKGKSREELTALMPEFKPHAACKTEEAKAKSIQEKISDFYEKAALSAFYGSILVIGLCDTDGEVVYLEGEEKEIIEEFWKIMSEYGAADRRWCFWSGCGAAGGFDLRFLIQRSLILGVKIPPFVRNGRFFSERIVDLAATFLLHDPTAYLSLSNAARIMGLIVPGSGLTVKSKTDEVTGANFAEWYMKDPQKALSYLNMDLKLTHAIASRIL